MRQLGYVYNDGGRSKYYKASGVGDCVVRAIAIASGRDYKEVYDMVRKATGETPRNGVDTRKEGFKKMMSELGFKWKATMGIGTGCKVHMDADELPNGNLVCSLSGHYTAVIDGVINDTYDSSRESRRCVYGFWYLQSSAPKHFNDVKTEIEKHRAAIKELRKECLEFMKDTIKKKGAFKFNYPRPKQMTMAIHEIGYGEYWNGESVSGKRVYHTGFYVNYCDIMSTPLEIAYNRFFPVEEIAEIIESQI